MIIVVGLGNPGKEYERTRHNAGFIALDKIVGKSDWAESKYLPGWYYKDKTGDEEVEYIKPSTFMNDSGVAIAYAKRKHPEAKLIVIHDDKDIPLGEIKVQINRGAGGHNGIKSIIERLGTKDFWRIRVGIAPTTNTPTAQATADFVLDKFSKDELTALTPVIEKIKIALTELIKQ
ncbi:MAG: aminoacyl-tRNA hydrolase [bacterium]|nr:aminoacyl-tRNA hydrolase [bacterium]